MDFAPRSGCPMCGIVAKAARSAPNSPASSALSSSRSSSQQSQGDSTLEPEILWRDENFTVYRERAFPVSSRGHLIIVFNLHVPSLYTLSSSDIPLLVSLRSLAHRFLSNLSSLSVPGSPAALQQLESASPPQSFITPLSQDSQQYRVGFITPPWKDNKIPVKDHLHAHAYINPADMCGWWRGMAFGPLAWYSVEDLVAEIRESTSNNRVKSGYEHRAMAPLDVVPDAGVRKGTADGVETTDTGLIAKDLETGEAPTARVRSPRPAPRIIEPQAAVTAPR